jgi:hypothetical protein
VVDLPPSPTALQANARDLERELVWFTRLLNMRFHLYFEREHEAEPEHQSVLDLEPPDLSESESPYAGFVQHYQLSFAEHVAIMLSLIPHIRPQLLDVFFSKNKIFDRKFTEFGGIRNGSEGDFFPTGETLLFILAANDLESRFALQGLFEREHFFARYDILRLSPVEAGDPPLKAPLRLSEDYLSYFTSGQSRRPELSVHFPAKYIETALTWEDLVLHPGTRRQIEEIETWIKHGDQLMNDWGMAAKLRPGYRSLFYGPPGTGKSMTACLLGKTTAYRRSSGSNSARNFAESNVRLP